LTGRRRLPIDAEELLAAMGPKDEVGDKDWFGDQSNEPRWTRYRPCSSRRRPTCVAVAAAVENLAESVG